MLVQILVFFPQIVLLQFTSQNLNVAAPRVLCGFSLAAFSGRARVPCGCSAWLGCGDAQKTVLAFKKRDPQTLAFWDDPGGTPSTALWCFCPRHPTWIWRRLYLAQSAQAARMEYRTLSGVHDRNLLPDLEVQDPSTSMVGLVGWPLFLVVTSHGFLCTGRESFCSSSCKGAYPIVRTSPFDLS